MDGLIEIHSVEQLTSYSDMLGNVYFLISSAHSELIKDHEAIRQCWVDKKVDEFSANFESASEYIWQLLVAISNFQEFLSYAGEAYTAADKQVGSL